MRSSSILAQALRARFHLPVQVLRQPPSVQSLRRPSLSTQQAQHLFLSVFQRWEIQVRLHSGAPGPFSNWRFYPAIAACLVFLLLVLASETKSVVPKLSGCAASGVFVILLFVSGCGGGSTTTTPPPLVTPKGNYTITVSAAARNLPAQTVSLTLTVN